MSLLSNKITLVTGGGRGRGWLVTRDRGKSSSETHYHSVKWGRYCIESSEKKSCAREEQSKTGRDASHQYDAHEPLST